MADPKQSAATPEEQVRTLYEDAETRTARAFEEMVAKPGFGMILARSAENMAALSRLSGDFADLVIRNLRLAGRADITRLARQLHRTEDKLERLLQEVEALRDEAGERNRGRENRNGADPGTRATRSPRAKS